MLEYSSYYFLMQNRFPIAGTLTLLLPGVPEGDSANF